LQFIINRVRKVKQMLCQMPLSDCIQDVQSGHQQLTASRCSQSIQCHRPGRCGFRNWLTLHPFNLSDHLLLTMRRPYVH